MPLRPLLLGALAALLVIAAPASAAVTTATVTAPADGFATTITGTDTFGPAFVVSGTSNGLAGDKVLVVCSDRADDFRQLGSAVVQAGGGWSLTVDGNGATDNHGYWPYSSCRLRGVPPGTAYNADVSGFAGPRISFQSLRRFTRNGVLEDAGLVMTGTEATQDMYGISSCGPCDAALWDPVTWTRSNYLFYGNGALYRNESAGYGTARGYLQVDGHNAFLSYLGSTFQTLPHRMPITVDDLALDRLDVTEQAGRCTTETVTPATSAAECGDVTGAGVTVKRTGRITGGGRIVTLTDRWHVTDGAKHRVDAQYEQYQRKPTTPADASLAYNFTWGGAGFGSYKHGESVPAPPPGAATILIQSSDKVPGGSADAPVGSITLSPEPDAVTFAKDNNGGMLTPYVFDLEPGQEKVITQRFELSSSLSSLTAAANVAADQLQPPSVTIAAPAAGSTIATRTVRLAGTALDNGGTPKLTVAGQEVAVAADGTWVSDVALPDGAQTVVARATDAAGNTAEASRAVTVAVPPAPATPVVEPLDKTAPKLELRGLRSTIGLAQLRRQGLRVKVACNEACGLFGQLLGTTRSAKVAKAGDLVVAEKGARLKAAGSISVTLKPTKRTIRAVRRKAKLRLVIVATDTTGNVRTARRTIRVR